MGGWVVYILSCADGTLYTGVTTDVARRHEQHNDGKASRYTRSRRPVRVVYQEAHPDQGSALRREAAIKAIGIYTFQPLSRWLRCGTATAAGRRVFLQDIQYHQQLAQTCQ